MSDKATIVERLRGVYKVPVKDGAGLLDGKDIFTRKFDNLPPMYSEAASAIEELLSALLNVTNGLSGDVVTRSGWVGYGNRVLNDFRK